jgi:hypothetical protein
MHGIMSDIKTFQHFDGAIITYSKEDLILLFKNSDKLKGKSYLKIFRLDGEIDIKHIFNIANKFFPVDSLTEEYFEIESL